MVINAAVTVKAIAVKDGFTNSAVGTASYTLSSKGTPVITWSNPADIVYGALLGGTQLNASTSVAGSFVYSPLSGVKLSAGLHQALSVTFAPTDTASYNGASATVYINVTPRDVTVTADAKTKVWFAADPALKYTFTPDLIAGDTFNGSLTREAGEPPDLPPASPGVY